MRHAKSNDYWDKVYRKPCRDFFVEVDLNQVNSIPKFEMPQKILALCGLNGAGKSTIVSAIKDILGLPLTVIDQHRLSDNVVQASFVRAGDTLTCSNTSGNRLSDHGWDSTKMRYIDCSGSTDAQNYAVHQNNFDEFLEQFEEYILPPEAIEDISYLSGKSYDFCGIRELDDIEDLGTIPYFRVVVDGIEYDSRSMGSGEHFLFYLFWSIDSVDSGTIVIIEEPETYVSIASQLHFSDFLGKQMAKKGITVILTTHSPYILNHIKTENIRIVSRMRNLVSIDTPDEDMSAEGILGIDHGNIGTFFVEDRVASDFLTIFLEDRAPHLLKKYSIDIAVGGESAISQRLEFPYSNKIHYSFIGVYDGDMRDRLNSNALNWKYCFLPGSVSLEEMFRKFLYVGDHLTRFCSYLAKEQGKIMAQLAKNDGLDHHDWFEELRKYLSIDGKSLVRAFYSIMNDDTPEFDIFLTELFACLNS